jgi:hypothetical protein
MLKHFQVRNRKRFGVFVLARHGLPIKSQANQAGDQSVTRDTPGNKNPMKANAESNSLFLIVSLDQ